MSKKSRQYHQSILFSKNNKNREPEIKYNKLKNSHLNSLGELAAGIAHEINNPINGIINYAQILMDNLNCNSEESFLAEKIIEESYRISAIVKNLLIFDHYKSTEKIPTPIEGVIIASISFLESQLERYNIKIKLNLEENLPTIIIDELQIEEAIINILRNSISALNEKYQTGHKNKLIKISVKKVKGEGKPYLQISLYDCGSGISSHILDKVFNPFFTTKTAIKSTGLGLSVTYNIIKNNGGNISINSKEGEYTEVIINLPA